MKSEVGNPKFFVATVIFAVGLLTAAATAKAGILDRLNVSPSRNISQSTSPGSAITPFSGRGTGVLDFTQTHGGVCADAVETCGSGNGDSCECDVFVGTVSLPKLGATTMTLNITTDDTKGFSNGSGECFPGTGFGSFCNKSNTCLGVFVNGSICTGVVSSALSPPPEVVELGTNEVFQIIPTNSNGSVAGTSGGGNLSIGLEADLASASKIIETGYTAINGSFQSKPTITTVTTP